MSRTRRVDRHRDLERPAVSRACLSAVAAQQGVDAETILVDNGSTDGTAGVRPRALSVGAARRARRRTAASPAATTPARARRAAGSSRCSTTTPCAEPGWLRGAARAASTRRAGFALDDVAHRLHARSARHRQRRRRAAAVGRRVQAASRRASVDAAAESREVFGVCGAACLMPQGGVRGARRIRRGLLRLARGRGPVVPRAAARLPRAATSPTPSCGITAAPRSAGVSAFAVFHGQRNLEWMYFKNTPASLLLRTLPGHLVYNAAAARALRARSACSARSCARSRRRLPAAGACCASAPPCSARGASAPTPSGRSSSRAGWRPSGARSGSTSGLAGAAGPTDDAGRRRRPRQLQRRARAAARRCSRSPTRWPAARGRRSSSTTRRRTAARRSRGSSRRRRALLRNAENVGFGRGVNQGVAASSAPLVLIMNPDCRLVPGAVAVDARGARGATRDARSSGRASSTPTARCRAARAAIRTC